MHVVVAPDSFGGTLTADEAAAAIAAGWARVRPDDTVVRLGLSDGGEGLVDVVGADDAWTVHVTEVAGPLGLPVQAPWLLREGRRGPVAVVEVARACGLDLVPLDRRDPLVTTTHGVGELLEAARAAGAVHVLVGLGGSATVDGGTGALTGLGLRLRRADGSGLKVGGGWVHELDRVERGWMVDGWDDVEVDLLADVQTDLGDAARVFGLQKGADADAVAQLTEGLETVARVVERDLDQDGLASRPGTGSAGGLGFALAAAIGGRLRAGAPIVAGLVGLDEALRDAELVLTGEGRHDATTAAGKVVAEVAERARTFGLDWGLVAGSGDVPDGIPGELSAPDGPGDDPAAEVADAAERLARRWPADGTSGRRDRPPVDTPHARDGEASR